MLSQAIKSSKMLKSMVISWKFTSPDIFTRHLSDKWACSLTIGDGDL
jgi:hypothetical protein